MANRATLILDVIKQIASDADGLNQRCYNGLLNLYNRDREDIIMNIKKLRASQPDVYTPEHFANYLKDIDSLIKRYDSIYTDRNIKNGYDLLEYEQKKIAYDVGESTENPDAR